MFGLNSVTKDYFFITLPKFLFAGFPFSFFTLKHELGSRGKKRVKERRKNSIEISHLHPSTTSAGKHNNSSIGFEP